MAIVLVHDPSTSGALRSVGGLLPLLPRGYRSHHGSHVVRVPSSVVSHKATVRVRVLHVCITFGLDLYLRRNSTVTGPCATACIIPADTAAAAAAAACAPMYADHQHERRRFDAAAGREPRVVLVKPRGKGTLGSVPLGVDVASTQPSGAWPTASCNGFGTRRSPITKASKEYAWSEPPKSEYWSYDLASELGLAGPATPATAGRFGELGGEPCFAAPGIVRDMFSGAGAEFTVRCISTS